MPLKAVLDDISELNEAQSALYVESDGKFYLDLDADSLKDHPGTKPLVVAYERVKGDASSAKQEASSLREQIAELQRGAPDTAATQAKLAQLQEQLDAKNAEVQDWQSKFTSVTRDQTLAQALQAAGITNPTFVKAAATMLKDQVKIGEDGTVYAETPMGPKVVQDYIKSWAAGDGKDFVSPPTGGGAKGNSAGSAPSTVSREDFEAMDPATRMATIRDGKAIVA